MPVQPWIRPPSSVNGLGPEYCQRGDIIRSDLFAFGVYSDDKAKADRVIRIDGIDYSSRKVTEFIPDEERLRMAASSGNPNIPKQREKDMNARDISRQAAYFFVEHVEMSGGSTGRDAYPDGWLVFARRMKNETEYEPDGEIITFYQSGCFNYTIYPKDVRITRRASA